MVYSRHSILTNPVIQCQGISPPTLTLHEWGSKALTLTLTDEVPCHSVSPRTPLRYRSSRGVQRNRKHEHQKQLGIGANHTAKNWPRRPDETLHQKMRRMVRVGLTVGASPANVAPFESWAHQN